MKENFLRLLKWLDATRLIMIIKYRFERCMEPGCWDPGNECFYPPDESDGLYEMKADVFYCVEHSSKAGFCWSCGQFWAGVEAFDFSPIEGICPNCISEFEDEGSYWDDEDDEDWEDDWDSIAVYGPDAEDENQESYFSNDTYPVNIPDSDEETETET